MYESTYHVDKTTDTFADALLAYGLAALLAEILRDNVDECTVTVRDAGSVYVVSLETPIEPGFEEVDWFCNLPFLEAGRKRPPEGWPAEIVNYDEQRERRGEYFEARRQLPREARRPGATVDEFPILATLGGLKPRPDWDILAQINQMSGIYAYSDVLTNWYKCRVCFNELLQLILKLFSTIPNDVDAALERWNALDKEYKLKVNSKKTVTPVQILNPSMGKGLNRPKTDRADILGNPKSFWVLEFLKFWGMRLAGLPRVVRSTQTRGPRDRKTYVLRPNSLKLATLREVYNPFSAVMWPSTAVKMDVLAALRFTDVFLEQWLAGALADVKWGEQPDDFVSGLAVAFYKDMGSASSVLNLAEIGLPEWMNTTNPEAGRAYRGLLEEHRRVVDSLGEDHGDEYRLLQFYRDFISAGDLRAFLEFSAGYAGLTMSRMDRGQWAPRFTTNNLEVLMIAQDDKLGTILENEGFQHVAAAIRRSTVIPQYFKAQGKSGPYAIRYGLGNELLRHAAYPEQFVQALGAFLHEYNRETGQMYERYKGNPPVRRSTVTTEDVEDVVKLIDVYDSETVASLLVAFGYAREPRDQEPEGDDESRQEE